MQALALPNAAGALLGGGSPASGLGRYPAGGDPVPLGSTAVHGFTQVLHEVWASRGPWIQRA